MSKLTTPQIREAFLAYFEAHGHKRVSSSSLVPRNDPTLLFTNAGMVQFKDLFTGRETRDYRRATSAQKCVRAGGKHNDLDNVGHTARHHTFFEMLGNFSFGDYFKAEAIRFAWELVTQVLSIPRDRLAVTIFNGEGGIPRDAEARRLWEELSGLPPDRIFELGQKDNFWAMGDTGPCGPCSEIHFFQGNDLPCPEPVCRGVACDCDRWLEIWNLVFMQFERDTQGQLSPLPKPSIDTGAGLERLAAVVQGVRSNYDTDLFAGLIGTAEQLTFARYQHGDSRPDVALRVLADHARATSFLICDGVLPSNEGRGYVLRRIMRRFIRYGTQLQETKSLLPDMCRAVVAAMGSAYPELQESEAFLLEVVAREEESFRRTLGRGMTLLEEAFTAHGGGDRRLPGEVVFKLYDTYGFPKDLTQIIAGERGYTVDEAGYESALAAQRARGEFTGSGEAAIGEIYPALRAKLGDTRFEGYDKTEGTGLVTALLRGGASVEHASAGEEVELITDATPFYGESGGQVGDAGTAEHPVDLAGPRAKLLVTDVQKPVGGLIVHHAKVLEGMVRAGERLTLRVDGARRDRIRANHSATHLLHWALKEVLGPHVKQAGSVVHPDYLRFDYSHFQGLSPEQLAEIESRANAEIRRNAPAETEELDLEQARQSGAVALFGEKYGERVRVLQLGPNSRELCGGTHVSRTGDIGFLKIQSESSIASGVRRLLAVTGEAALRHVQDEEATLRKAAELLKGSPKELVSRVESATRRVKELEQELTAEKRRLASAQSGDLLDQARLVKDVKVLAVRTEAAENGAMRELADRLRDKLGSGIVVLGGEKDGKALLLVAVTKDLVGRFKAGDLVRELAKEVGGSGGGKPDLAQAGGPDGSKLGQALERVFALI